MPHESSSQASNYRFRRTVLMVVIAVSMLGTLSAWYIMGVRGQMSHTLRAVQGTTSLVLLALFLIAWFRLLPQRVLELCCLLYTVAICAACMALRMYSPRYGAAIDLDPLYLWIPVVYLFAFMLTDHKTGVMVSCGIFVLFVVVSLPYLVHDIRAPYANFTVQLHIVSSVMITTLYFFSSYQHRLRQAQVTVGKLAHLSNTDDLTRLPNRRHVAMVIGEELAQFRTSGRGFALILLDIDHFKMVNDRFGHAAGDAALVALAARATEVIHGMGTLGRWGGDEFLALVRNGDAGDAVRMAEALCAYVASSPLFDSRLVTISCGVTVVRHRDNIDSLLQRADAALYAAKRAGRNRAESVIENGEAGPHGSRP